jgi:hypothetical protein
MVDFLRGKYTNFLRGFTKLFVTKILHQNPQI